MKNICYQKAIKPKGDKIRAEMLIRYTIQEGEIITTETHQNVGWKCARH
jgi:hypothetical protein